MIKKTDKSIPYTCISNDLLQNQTRQLSLKAKGLLCTVLSLPDDWIFSVNGLIKITGEKRGTVESALKELENAGFLEIKKIMPKTSGTGRIRYEYTFADYNPIQKKQGTRHENSTLEIDYTRKNHETRHENSTLVQGAKKTSLKKTSLENSALYKRNNNTNTITYTNNQNKKIEMPEYMKVPIETNEATIPEDTLNDFRDLMKSETFRKASKEQRMNMLRATCSTIESFMKEGEETM